MFGERYPDPVRVISVGADVQVGEQVGRTIGKAKWGVGWCVRTDMILQQQSPADVFVTVCVRVHACMYVLCVGVYVRVWLFV